MFFGLLALLAVAVAVAAYVMPRRLVRYIDTVWVRSTDVVFSLSTTRRGRAEVPSKTAESSQQGGKTRFVLTIDDVPYGHAIDPLIAIVERYAGATASCLLFVISSYVEGPLAAVEAAVAAEVDGGGAPSLRYPHYRSLVEAVRRGHHLGNHGSTNARHATLAPAALANEIDACHQLIASVYRVAKVPLPATLAYRPGSGLFTASTVRVMQRVAARVNVNYRLVLGNVYPHDAHVVLWPVNYAYLRWLKGGVQDGDIVILHDRAWTPPLLERWLGDLARRRGDVQIVPLYDFL